MSQKILYTNLVSEALGDIIAEMKPAGVYVITDTNVEQLVLLRLNLPDVRAVIAVEPGDENKDLLSLSHIWGRLSKKGATRKSLVINIGGGVVTDMGGFAAATFKRGVRFVNVPTTLLSAVDAAVGGKTGINFDGLKNEIGAFAPADAVVISTIFFSTLPHSEILSGYAEMLKHGLLSSPESFAELLAHPLDTANPEALLSLLEQSVKVKERIVLADPLEKGLRRALNLGHTAGHAFEALALERGCPVPHGYAVAWGTLVELILSHLKEGMDSKHLHALASFLRSQGYGTPAIDCKDYPELIALMRHDKKNDSPEAINFTLLGAPGDIRIDRTASEEEITASLDIFRDLLGM